MTKLKAVRPAKLKIRLIYFFITLMTGPRKSFSLKLRVYEPQIRARLGTTAHFCKVVVRITCAAIPAIKQAILFGRFKSQFQGMHRQKLTKLQERHNGSKSDPRTTHIGSSVDRVREEAPEPLLTNPVFSWYKTCSDLSPSTQRDTKELNRGERL